MPKVTGDHRKAQEDRFIGAARRCFTRLGVERTSMEQIRSEAGVSAGLMYRYFASKDDMIRASIVTSLDRLEILIAATGTSEVAATSAGYLRLLLGTLRTFRRHDEGVDLFKLAIQGWAHAQSRPETKAAITESFSRQLSLYRAAAARWTTAEEDAEAAALAIAAAVIGYVVQGAFSDAEVDLDLYCKGLGALHR